LLATSLEVMVVPENRYSGIPTIRREMREGKHPAPEFSSIHGEFKVCLHNSVSEAVSGSNRKADLLEFLHTPRTKKEIADFLGISSVTYAIKTYIQPLVEQGQVGMTIPEAPGSRMQKFFSEK
ncbi:MAG: DNA helicase, partial [Oscillospiraceae bacterium]|nr:DNA helicase [Oscillospiraceae bacterium]